MTEIVNLTPHAVVFCDGEGIPYLTIPPSGTVARCAVRREKIGFVDWDIGHEFEESRGIPVYTAIFGAVEGLPEPSDSRVYVVSRIVAEAARRGDCLVPDDTVRDNEGRIIGCRALARV